MERKCLLFVFPGQSKQPVGGFKIAFQYADYLANEYDVHLLFPKLGCRFINSTLPDKIKRLGKAVFSKVKSLFKKKQKEDFWFEFKNTIFFDTVFTLSSKIYSKYPNDSLVVATSVETAHSIHDSSNFIPQNVYYLIQDYELWNTSSEEYIKQSFGFGFKNIVISKWLSEIVQFTGNKAVLVPNGFDFEYFSLSTPIENRKNDCVAMLYHTDNRKRCEDAIAAVKLVKTKIPTLKVLIFGTTPRPEFLPDWFEYYQKPDREKHNYIYNTASIFVAASEQEGWGLPCCEAMLCGDALACTDIGGFKMFAHHEKTALLSPVHNPQALADNILRLICDNELRIRLALKGSAFIQQFSLEKSCERFKSVLENYDTYLE